MIIAELDTGSIDILLVTESWLSCDCSSAFILGPLASRFVLLRKDRDGERVGGGVCVFVRSDLKPRALPFAFASEMVGFDLSLEDAQCRVICVYRPPPRNSEEQTNYLVSMCDDLRRSATDCPIMVAGDFNFDRFCLDWSVPEALSTPAREFLGLCMELNLSQHVMTPTRGDNTLDLVLSFPTELVASVGVSECFLPSDHCQVDFLMFPSAKRGPAKKDPPKRGNAQPPATGPIRRAWKRADYQKISAFLADIDFGYILSLPLDATGLLSFLIYICNDAIERFVPPAGVLTPRSALPPRLNALRKKRFCLLRKGPDFRQQFRAIDRRYRRSLHAFFLARERSIVNGAQYGVSSWMRLNVGPGSKGIPDIRTADGSVISDPREKATLFAERFSEDFSADNGIPLSLPPCEPPFFGRPTITAPLVEGTLAKMAPKMSSGEDGVPVRFLRAVRTELALPLSELYRRMLYDADCPQAFLPVITVPVPKAGKRADSLDGYRPVSLGSAFARVFERIANRQLMSFLVKNERIPRSQFGFLPGHSCLAQLVEYSDAISRNMTLGKTTFAVMLDLKSAFLAPPPAKLIESLAAVGVIPPFLTWMAEYLSCRTFRVSVDGSLSDSYPVLSGGVQGSSLSCTAFLCYIAPVLRDVDALEGVRCFTYADDIKLLSTCPRKLQEALDTLVSNLDSRQMRLSIHKCVALRFPAFKARGSSKDPPPPITINGLPLDYAAESSATRDLGVLIDDKLTFSKHVSHIAARCRFVSAQILRNFRSKSPDILTRAFKVYAMPLIDFASPLWAGAAKKDIDSLEKCLKWFTRRIFMRCHLRMLPFEDRLSELGLTSIHNRLIANDLSFAHAVHHKRHRCEALLPSPVIHDYPTSHSSRFTVERRRKGPRLNCPSNRIAIRWNRLNPCITGLKKRAFSIKIKKLIESQSGTFRSMV